jgi:hypothetical protein
MLLPFGWMLSLVFVLALGASEEIVGFSGWNIGSLRGDLRTILNLTELSAGCADSNEVRHERTHYFEHP